MKFRLVLETAGAGGRGQDPDRGLKDIGENVFMADLPAEYPCYAFYYPGAMPEPELEAALRAFGEQTGGNLFVNIGQFNDPDYGRISKLFGIERNPVIVLTAIAPLAAPDGTDLNTFVRLDSRKLLASTERTLECVQQVFTLYLQGKVAEAIAKGKSKERAELLRVVGDAVRGALAGLWDYIAKTEISVSVVEGRFELKPAGG